MLGRASRPTRGPLTSAHRTMAGLTSASRATGASQDSWAYRDLILMSEKSLCVSLSAPHTRYASGARTAKARWDQSRQPCAEPHQTASVRQGRFTRRSEKGVLGPAHPTGSFFAWAPVPMPGALPRSTPSASTARLASRRSANARSNARDALVLQRGCPLVLHDELPNAPARDAFTVTSR